MSKWLKLQNGSDIRGVAVEGVAGEPVTLTEVEVQRITAAFAKWLADKSKVPVEDITIGLGRDSRISGEALMTAAAHGIQHMGATAYNCGITSTPSMFMSTIFEETQYTGGIMITASHLPFNRNGLKFFTKDGGLDKPDIKAILTACEDALEAPKATGSIPTFDLVDRYASHLQDIIRKGVNHPDHYDTPLAGLHIIVDAGNGAGGFYASKVLATLGANTEGSQFLDPDGMFPNHVPNPEDNTAMDAIQQATIATGADLGIIFDTDVDRAAIVDGGGKIINRNRLIALMAAIVLEDTPGGTIVTDSVTSDGLATFIQGLGGVHHRFKRGYKNVINESVRLNNQGTDSPLAIETSGHGALKENYFLDDGAYIVTKTLIALSKLQAEGRKLSDLIADLAEPAESKEFRVKIKAADFGDYGKNVIANLERFVQENDDLTLVPNNFEGIRIGSSMDQAEGWMLIRLSLHDPVLPINIESEQAGGVAQLASRLEAWLKTHDQLDLSCF